MLYRDERTRTLVPVVRQMLRTPFPSRTLGQFGQRRHFSDPLKDGSYDVDQFQQSHTETRPHEIEPIDVRRGARETMRSLTDPGGFYGGGGGGEGSGGGGSGTITGSGINNRAAMWTSGTNLSTMDIIRNGSNIGINTSTADEQLDVNGTIKAPTIRLTTSPTTGHIWTCTNGTTGAGSWQANAGGGGGSSGVDVVGHFFLGGM